MISAVVFVFWPDEENYIEACLKCLDFVDEIIVIDNGATEATTSIVKKYTTKIFKNSDKDFSVRHNFAMSKVKGDWILYVDADERVSQSLKDEIIRESKEAKFDAFKLNRVNFFLGKQVKFGDRFPDYVTRLFKKDKIKGWVGSVHESSVVDGTTGQLNSPLYHITHRDIYSMILKTTNFSEHEAKMRLKSGHPPVVGWRLVRVFLSEFFTRIIKYQGWRQGTEGWIDGIFQSFSLFVVYARLWEMQRVPQLEKQYQLIDEDIITGKI